MAVDDLITRAVERAGAKELLLRLGEARADLRTVDAADLGDGPAATALAAGDHDTAARILIVDGEPGLVWDALPMAERHRLRQAVIRHRDADLPEHPLADVLATDGIVAITGAVPAELIERWRADFQRFANELDEQMRRGRGVYAHYHERDHFWPADAAYVTNDAFVRFPGLTTFATQPAFLDLAHAHLGAEPVVQRAGAMRYLPNRTTEEWSQFRWHHDREDRRVKLMVLLDDVDEDGQAMRYLAGSHHVRHSLQRFREGTPDPRLVEKFLDAGHLRYASGTAGDVIVFDSNGAHTATRHPDAPLRDVLTIEFGGRGCNILGGNVPAEELSGLDDRARRVLTPLAHSTPMWERSDLDRSMWQAGLADPASWLPVPASSA